MQANRWQIIAAIDVISDVGEGRAAVKYQFADDNIAECGRSNRADDNCRGTGRAIVLVSVNSAVEGDRPGGRRRQRGNPQARGLAAVISGGIEGGNSIDISSRSGKAAVGISGDSRGG